MRRPIVLAIVSLAALTALGTALRAAHAADAGGARLAIRGRLTLPSGAPVKDARVIVNARDADGSAIGPGRGFKASSDDSGRFAIEVPLPDRATIARRGYTLNLWAIGDLVYFLALDGQASLGVELHLETLPDGTVRVVGTANDPRLAALAARAVATTTRVELDGVLMTGVMGKITHEPAMPRRLEVARVAVGAPAGASGPAPAPSGATAPAKPPATPAPGNATHAAAGAGAAKTGAGAPATSSATPSATGATPAPGAGATPLVVAPPPAAADSFRVSTESAAPPHHATAKPEKSSGSTHTTGKSTKKGKAAGAAAPITAVVTPVTPAPEPAHPAPPADTACVCRITGTVEATAGEPLREPLRVAVGLEGEPAYADTVTLDMGSPRGFELRDVPCGLHRLHVNALGEKARYTVRDAEHVLPLSCERGRRLAIRVELVAR